MCGNNKIQTGAFSNPLHVVCNETTCNSVFRLFPATVLLGYLGAISLLWTTVAVHDTYHRSLFIQGVQILQINSWESRNNIDGVCCHSLQYKWICAWYMQAMQRYHMAKELTDKKFYVDSVARGFTLQTIHRIQ